MTDAATTDGAIFKRRLASKGWRLDKSGRLESLWLSNTAGGRELAISSDCEGLPPDCEEWQAATVDLDFPCSTVESNGRTGSIFTHGPLSR